MPSGKLNPRHKEFIRQYFLCHRNATEAYRKVYPKCKTPEVNASRLLANAKFSAHLAEHERKIQEKFDITQEMIIKELAVVAFGNLATIVDEDGNLLDPDKAAFISSVSKSESQSSGDTSSSSKSFSYSTQNKVKALELLGKHVGMWKEKDAAASNEWLPALTRAIEKLDGEK